jgi:23S rRNA (guanosine2251-2'-O)-methyltransferase
VYGLHAVMSALLNPAREIKAIYATDSTINDLQPALDVALENGIILPEVTIVDKEQLHKALPREAVHQGVGLDAKPLEEVFLQDIIRKASVRKKSIVVLLDQVTDPHNIGAILRSACAFGADAIVVQSRNAPEMSGLIAKTASGAAEHVPFVYETNLSRAIEALKEEGYFALALDERGTAIGDAPTYEKTLLVLGAEGPGLRPLVKEHCDLMLKLPTSGPISSLNVSNAAAVALFAIASKAK